MPKRVRTDFVVFSEELFRLNRLLQARACAPNASRRSVKRNHLFPPTKEKNPERFRKIEKSLLREEPRIRLRQGYGVTGDADITDTLERKAAFSAKGARSSAAWGDAPGFVK